MASRDRANPLAGTESTGEEDTVREPLPGTKETCPLLALVELGQTQHNLFTSALRGG